MALRVCRRAPDPIPQLRVNRADLSSAETVEIDPMYGPAVRRNVWSGRASQEDFIDLADVRSCINVSGL